MLIPTKRTECAEPAATDMVYWWISSMTQQYNWKYSFVASEATGIATQKSKIYKNESRYSFDRTVAQSFESIWYHVHAPLKFSTYKLLTAINEHIRLSWWLSMRVVPQNEKSRYRYHQFLSIKEATYRKFNG